MIILLLILIKSFPKSAQIPIEIILQTEKQRNTQQPITYINRILYIFSVIEIRLNRILMTFFVIEIRLKMCGENMS